MDGLPVKTSARLFRLSTYHQSVNGFSYTATPLRPLKCVNRQIRHGCQARVRKKLTMLHIHFPPPYNQLHTYDWGEIFSTLSWHAHTKNKLRFSPYPRTPHPTTHTHTHRRDHGVSLSAKSPRKRRGTPYHQTSRRKRPRRNREL